MALPGEHIMFPLNDADTLASFRSAVESLPTFYEANAAKADQKNCFGAAISVGTDVLGEQGGKVIAFQTSLPTVGVGKLTNRDNPSFYGTKKERELFRTASEFYDNLGLKCAEVSSKPAVAVDVFTCSGTYA